MEKRKVGQRGPDKSKRSHGGGMPSKAAEQKAKPRGVSLTDAQDKWLTQTFGGRTKALKSLLPPYLLALALIFALCGCDTAPQSTVPTHSVYQWNDAAILDEWEPIESGTLTEWEKMEMEVVR